MDVNVVEVKNRNVVDLDKVENLLKATLSSQQYPPFETLKPHLKDFLFAPHISFLLGFEDGEPKGLAIIGFPTSELETIPQVIHLYNEGKVVLRKELIKAVVDIIGKKGYTRFWAINGSGRPDKVWVRGMKVEGWTVKPAATIMEFGQDG